MTAPEYHLVVSEEGLDEDREAIYRPLIAYNRSIGPEPNYSDLALLIKDGAGATIGGIWGRIYYDWFYIDLFFIPAPLRRTGLGSKLMRQAEDLARERSCIGIWLDTFYFQARPFYEKLGYRIFGELKDHPPGSGRYWLQKRLD